MRKGCDSVILEKKLDFSAAKLPFLLSHTIHFSHQVGLFVTAVASGRDKLTEDYSLFVSSPWPDCSTATASTVKG